MSNSIGGMSCYSLVPRLRGRRPGNEARVVKIPLDLHHNTGTCIFTVIQLGCLLSTVLVSASMIGTRYAQISGHKDTIVARY